MSNGESERHVKATHVSKVFGIKKSGRSVNVCVKTSAWQGIGVGFDGQYIIVACTHVRNATQYSGFGVLEHRSRRHDSLQNNQIRGDFMSGCAARTCTIILETERAEKKRHICT
jgi:hypothetical protein